MDPVLEHSDNGVSSYFPGVGRASVSYDDPSRITVHASGEVDGVGSIEATLLFQGSQGSYELLEAEGSWVLKEVGETLARKQSEKLDRLVEAALNPPQKS